jgi:hypothetical protein
MSDVRQREKLLHQVQIETQALATLIKAKRLLQLRQWFSGVNVSSEVVIRDRAICAQMAISAVSQGKENNEITSMAMYLLLEEARIVTGNEKWISIPHWNDAQKDKKDVLKVFDQTIVNLQKKLQPV